MYSTVDCTCVRKFHTPWINTASTHIIHMTVLRTAHAFLRYQTSATFKSAIGMSAEPNRKRAYSSDIRWRIVYQRVGMELTYPKIATNLNIQHTGRFQYLNKLEL